MMGDYPCVQLKLMKNGVFEKTMKKPRGVEQPSLHVVYKTKHCCAQNLFPCMVHSESGAVHPHREAFLYLVSEIIIRTFSDPQNARQANVICSKLNDTAPLSYNYQTRYGLRFERRRQCTFQTTSMSQDSMRNDN